MHIEVIIVIPGKTPVSITLDADIADRLRLLAQQDQRSLSSYINLVLKEHLLSHSLSAICKKEPSRN